MDASIRSMSKKARSESKKHRDRAVSSAIVSTPGDDAGKRKTAPLFVLAVLLLFAAVCYWPLLRYFFAQDDFMLLYASTRHLGEELAKTFGPYPYHFRPLTEFLYFAGMFKTFGFNPAPYHVVSLLIHLGNTTLVYLLLRAMRLPAAATLVATALFGMSVAWLHVVGWVTCIQQLAPQFFGLATLLFAVRALHSGSRREWGASVAAYVVTLFCYEQQALLPLSIALIAFLGVGVSRRSLVRTVRVMLPHAAILAVYSGMRLFWKGVPDEGRAGFKYGSNVWDNLMAYLGGMLDFWPNVTMLIAKDAFDFRLTHILFIGLIAYHIQSGRWRHVVFSFVFVVTMLLPTLFLERHYYYYHTYAASFGVIYLIALAAKDGFDALGRFRLATPPKQLAVASIVIVLICSLSFWKVRANEKRLETERYPNISFVLQRANMARRAYNHVTMKAGDLSGVENILMMIGKPGVATSKGYTPFMWALAHGKAVNLFLNNYAIDVSMDPKGDIDPRIWETQISKIFYYDLQGNVFTTDEVLSAVDTTRVD